MKKNNRVKTLLLMLLDSEHYIATKELANNLNVSTRTIFNDLQSDVFLSMLYGARIDRRSNLGIKLIATSTQRKKISYNLYEKELPNLNSYYFSDVENILLLFLKEEGDFTTKQKLSEYLFVDVNSIDSRIKETNKYLYKDHLIIEARSGRGLELKGTEINKRAMFKRLISDKVYHNFDSDIKSKNTRVSDSTWSFLELICGNNLLQDAISLVDLSEINLNETYTNFDYETLIIKFCIRIMRLIKQSTIEHSQLQYTEKNREYLIAQLLGTRLEKLFNVDINKFEVYDITKDIISTRRIDYNSNQAMFIHEEIVSKFMEIVSAGLGIDLNDDAELKHNLTKHLIPAIHRIRHGIHVENPILKHIKFEYTQEYIVVMTSIEEIEKSEGIIFDENELGYICLHVVAAVNRASNGKTISAILICDNGLAISSYLASRVEQQFKDIRVEHSFSHKQSILRNLDSFDLILNATKNEILGQISQVMITDILSEIDQNKIRNWLIDYRYHSMIQGENKLMENFYFFDDDSKSKEELIIKYSKILELDKFVTESFAKSCIEREKTIPTTLGRGIALPHGSEEYVIQSATLVARLKEPIPWDDQMVNLVFLIAIDKANINDFRNLIKQINTVLNDENKLNRLQNAKHESEIKDILFLDRREL